MLKIFPTKEIESSIYNKLFNRIFMFLLILLLTYIVYTTHPIYPHYTVGKLLEPKTIYLIFLDQP